MEYFFDGKKRNTRKVKGKNIAQFNILKKEFLKTKNGIDPKFISKKSQVRFYWKCNKNHIWRAKPSDRFNSSGKHKITLCPYCRGTKITKKTSFGTLHKKASNMLHPNKNIGISLFNIAPASRKVLWWMCKKKHEFKASVISRKITPSFCPYCGNRRAGKDNNLEVLYPEIAKQWDYTKNESREPKDVVATSYNFAWWVCKKNPEHSWKALIYQRTVKDQGCPYCSNNKISPDKSNSFGFLFPHLLKEWNYKRNKEHDPFKITPGSDTKVWWICKNKHEWKTVVMSRTSGSNCKKCVGIGISYAEIRVYSELIKIFKEVKWSEKIHNIQADIYIPEIKLAIEIDGEYWHKKENRIKHDNLKNKIFKKNKINLVRIRGYGLPLMGKNDFNEDINHVKFSLLKKLLEKILVFNISTIYKTSIKKYLKKNSFQNIKVYNKIVSNLPSPTYENSLEVKSREISKEWDYKKNYPLKPNMFKKNTNIRAWWICKNKHSYEAVVANRTLLKRGCPFCAGRYATKKNNLSILNPSVSKDWNYKLNSKIPKDFTPTSGQYVWWNCKYGHIYRKSIAHRTHNSEKSTGRNRDCPCQTKHQNGKLYSPSIFPLLRKEFSSKNKFELKKLTIFNNKNLLWKCKRGHEFKNSIFRRIFYMERCIKCYDFEIELRKPLHIKSTQ